MNIHPIFLLIILTLIFAILKYGMFEFKRRKRRHYYRNNYLKSEAWQRKRFLVMKRDNWTCILCGAKATQVHHKKYAKKNIGNEPIDWLVSVCKPCHEKLHNK